MPYTLDQVLADADASAAFRRRCVSEFSTENYDAYIEITQYASNPTVDGFNSIYNTYIKTGLLNLSPLARQAIENAHLTNISGTPLPTPPKAGVFTAAQKDLKDNMGDTFARFKLSPEGERYNRPNSTSNIDALIDGIDRVNESTRSIEREDSSSTREITESNASNDGLGGLDAIVDSSFDPDLEGGRERSGAISGEGEGGEGRI